MLVFFGWMNIYSSLYQKAHSYSTYPWNTASRSFIGSSVVLALLILFVLPPNIRCLRLVALRIDGSAVGGGYIYRGKYKGSHSWLQIGSMRVQPAEVSKITTSLALAHLMSKI